MSVRLKLNDLARLPHFHLFVFFCFVAVLVRIIFMIYTGRIWEDALIALTSARNFWDGFGLTHHDSEPPVQSFSSVIGEIIMIFGEAFGKGILAIQLASIVSAVASIYFAFRIGVQFSFNLIAQALVLSYLALDHLQVFFGMAGMETQVVTAILLANAYYYLSSRWTALGLATALAILSRPEFVLWAFIIFIVILAFHREAVISVFTPVIIVALSWAMFAISYFGTITPQTVSAKSIVYNRKPFAPLPDILDFCIDWWKHISPFRQYWAVSATPVPDFVLMIVVLVLLGFAFIGAYRASIENRRFLAIVFLVAGFAVYRTVTANGPYSMWYLPPFMALFFLFAAAGISYVGRWNGWVARVVGGVLILAYSIPIFFAMPLDKMMQVEIEVGVRTKVGHELARAMKSTDTVVLEPLGYIGWAIRNKSVYDYPGLASPVALNALMKRPGTGLGGMMDTLSPTFAVLRPDVLRDIKHYLPKTADRYEIFRHVMLERPVNLSNYGLRYMLIDDEFYILRRIGDDNY